MAFAVFPAIAEKMTARIDGIIEQTTQAINAVAEALKQGVAKLLDVLASVINGLLSVVQAAYNFALGAMSLIAKGEFGKLGQYIVQSALKLIGASLGGLMQLLGISEEDVQKIIADPVGFLKNLVGAVKSGLNKFVANIVKHLTSGLLGWLFGAFANVGIQLPTKFDLASIFTFIAQIVGVTYGALRARLVKRLGSTGETIVSAFEKSFAFMKDFITRGPIVLWERVQGALSNLKELLFTPVIEWLRNTIIVKAITKLVAFFNPVGAIVQAVQAIYNVVMFFKERWEQIKSFAQTVFSSIKNIAAGKVGAAAGFIEQSLAKAIPIMISFLARLIGLGGIVDKVKKVIGKIKKPIDKAVDKVIGWLVKMARKVWAKLKDVLGKAVPKCKKPKTQAERNQQVKEGLAELHREENKIDEDKDKKLTLEEAQTVAKRIKKRFPVFSILKVIDAGTRWDYKYKASPEETEEGLPQAGNIFNAGLIPGGRPGREFFLGPWNKIFEHSPTPFVQHTPPSHPVNQDYTSNTGSVPKPTGAYRVAGQRTPGAKKHTDAWRKQIDKERDNIKKSMRREWLDSNPGSTEIPKGVVGQIDRNAKRQVESKYGGIGWRELRLELVEPYWQGHHIHPVDWGGSDDKENVIYLPREQHAFYEPWFRARKKQVREVLRGE